MTLKLELNQQQADVLDDMLESGLYGANTNDVAIRLLDRAFIDYAQMPPEPDRREPWQREGDHGE